MSTSSDNGNGYDSNMNDGPVELHNNRKLSQDDPTMAEVIRIGKSSTNGPIKGFPENMSIKAQLGEDIRRVSLNNEDITYDELVLMMQRLFRGALKSQDEIVLKYKDEDGDMITIVDTNDLAYAVEHCQVLRVKIFPKITKKERADVSVSLLKQEMKGLRDRVDSILDYLDDEDGRILPRFLPSGSFCSDKQSIMAHAATAGSSEAGGSRPESKSTVPAIVGAGDIGGFSSAPSAYSKDFEPMTSIASVQAHVTDGPAGRGGMVNGTSQASSAIVVQPQPQQPPTSAQAQAPAQTAANSLNATDFPPQGIMAISGHTASRFAQATAPPHAHQVLGVSQSQPGIPPMVSSAQSQAQATAKAATMGYGGYGTYNPASGSAGYGGSLPGQQPPSQPQQQQYGTMPQAAMPRPTPPPQQQQQQQQQQPSIYSALGGGDHGAPGGPFNPMAPPSQLGGQAQPMAPPSMSSHTLPSQPGQGPAGAQSQQQQQATPYPAVSMPNMTYGSAPPAGFPQQPATPYRPPSGPPPSGTPGAFGSNPYSRQAANTQQYRPPM